MPINVNDPKYVAAEKEYHEANSAEDKLIALKKMISHAPKHKGGENLRQQLTTRRKKFEKEIIKKKKSRKSSYKGIKKEDMQAIIVGKTNSGKSSLISLLTNAKSKISENKFTTIHPIIGMMKYKGVQIQLIENPAIESEYYDKGIVHTADTIIILINSLNEINFIKGKLNTEAKQILIFNNKNKSSEDIRKIKATLASKKYNFEIANLKSKKNLEELKEKIFQSFDKIRVFTKEPGKERSKKPMILKPNATVEDAAEKILKGFSKTIKETKIWGPSSKFSGQKIGLKHKLKDLDVVEFKTR